MRVFTAALATTLATSLAAAGCAGTPAHPDPEDVEDGFTVEEGKEDDFLSLSAKEYVVEGTTTVTVEPGEGLERAKQLIALKQLAIAWFMNQYLIDKEEDAANHAYGGFGAMAKAGSYQELEITDLGGGVYSFKFAQIIAGNRSLLTKLPLVDGKLSLEIGKPSNQELAELETNSEWYRNAPWNDWNPANVPADQKETLSLTLREEKKPVDAWWDYAALVDDDKLTIDVHFGWDYHSEYHLKHSRAFYTWLKSHGFRSPVSSFDAYTRTSGPLTKKIDVDGRDVVVEVKIFYGKPGSETDPDTDAGGRVLEADMNGSLRNQDVIVYSGHSGPLYGFALANWKKTLEGDFDDDDMRAASLPGDKYQIVVAEGCDTYMIGPAFLENPHKAGKNVDVITTTSFSNASSPAAVQDFVGRLIETDSSGRHRPRPMSTLLEDLDGNSYWFNTMYGIHGINDNPRLHPYANAGAMCTSCTKNADCGGPGNACIKFGAQPGKKCTAACTDDSGCPTGYKCKAVASASSNAIYGRMCAPVGNRCP